MSLVFKKIPGNLRIMRAVLLSFGQAMALREERAEQEKLHLESESNTEHPSVGREDEIVTEDVENGPSDEGIAQDTEYTEDEDEDEDVDAENKGEDRSVHKGAGNKYEDKRVPKGAHKQQDLRPRERPRRCCRCNHQPIPDHTETAGVINPVASWLTAVALMVLRGVALVFAFSVTALSLWCVFQSFESATWTVHLG